MLHPTEDLRIQWTKVVLPPVFLEEELPVTEAASSTIFNARNETAATAPGSVPVAPANTTTITIIDGKTGAHQDVVVATRNRQQTPPAGGPAASGAVPSDQKFVEITQHGPIPKMRPMARGRRTLSLVRCSRSPAGPTRPALR